LKDLWVEHMDEITFVKRGGRVDPASLRMIAEKYLDGYHIGLNRSGQYRNQFEIEHPEIKAPDK